MFHDIIPLCSALLFYFLVIISVKLCRFLRPYCLYASPIQLWDRNEFWYFLLNIEEGFALKIITYFTLPYKTCSESSLWCQVGIGSTCSNLRDIPSVLIVLFWSYNSIIFFLMYTCLEFCWKVYIFFCILVAYLFLDIRSVIWYRFFFYDRSLRLIFLFLISFAGLSMRIRLSWSCIFWKGHA